MSCYYSALICSDTLCNPPQGRSCTVRVLPCACKYLKGGTQKERHPFRNSPYSKLEGEEWHASTVQHTCIVLVNQQRFWSRSDCSWLCNSNWHIYKDKYKDFINWTCHSVSVINATHILTSMPWCARAHDCIGYHWLSVIDNLCLIDRVKKVIGWSLLRWNSQSPDLYPSYNPPPFHLL